MVVLGVCGARWEDMEVVVIAIVKGGEMDVIWLGFVCK